MEGAVVKMALKKTTKDIVGAGLILGVGGMTLGAMGQDAIIAPTIGRAGSMMGVVVPAAFGFEALRLVDEGSRKLQRRR